MDLERLRYRLAELEADAEELDGEALDHLDLEDVRRLVEGADSEEGRELAEERLSSLSAAVWCVMHPPTAEELAERLAAGIRASVHPEGAPIEALVSRPRTPSAVVQDGTRLDIMARLARSGYAAMAERYGITDADDPARAASALTAEAEGLVASLASSLAAMAEPRAEALREALELASGVLATVREEDGIGPPGSSAILWTLSPLVEALRAASGEAQPETLAALAALEAAPRRDLPATVELPSYVTRSPIFAPASRAVEQLALWSRPWAPGSLYRHPFTVLETQGPLTMTDALLLAHLVRRYNEDGRPDHRRVTFSLSEAVRWLGYSEEGGNQRRLIRRALLRMRATAYESVVPVEGGAGYRTIAWGLIDTGVTAPTLGGVRGGVTLNEALVDMVRSGVLAHLEADTFRRLVHRDELAARLWLFLEGEDGPGLEPSRSWHTYGQRFPLFSAPEGEPPAEGWTPAIADTLRIASWSRRRDVASRVRRAMAAVEAEDGRYRLALEASGGRRSRGMWTLWARRSLALKEGTSRRAGGYAETRGRVRRDAREGTPRRAIVRETGPNEILNESVNEILNATPSISRDDCPAPPWDGTGAVMAAWSTRYPRPPTERQLGVLDELVARHDAAGIARALREAPPGSDALRAVMAWDRRDGADRRRERPRPSRSSRSSRPEAVASGLARLMGVEQGGPRSAPIPPSAPVVEAPRVHDEAEIAARRREAALAMLRAGLAGSIADRLRAEHGISNDEL